MLRKKEKKFGGVCKMQEKKHCDGKELICINVDKVYDWIVKEKTFDFSPTGPLAFNPTGSVPMGVFTPRSVTCEVSPAMSRPIVILHRENRTFCIDGKNVVLQQLTIQKNFTLTIFVCLENGTVLTRETPISRCEHVTLCAPKGTEVEVTYTDIDCFVCSTGTLTGVTDASTIEFSDLTISVATCQSIQSTFPVTVEFLADFCEPREELSTASPAPHRPKQCSVVFPDDDHGNCCH